MRRRAGLSVNGSPAYRRLHRACASGLANRRTTRPTFRHANAGHVPQRQDLERRIRPPWLRALRSGAGRFSWAHVEAALRMLRREARLRREYLYRKAREEERQAAQDRKEKVRRALEGTSVPPPRRAPVIVKTIRCKRVYLALVFV